MSAIQGTLESNLKRYGMSVLKRGNRTKLFDVLEDSGKNNTKKKYTLAARTRIGDYKNKIKIIERCIAYWKDVRKQNKIGEHVRQLKQYLRRLRNDSAGFKKRNALSVKLIRRILCELKEHSRVPKCDFHCTYVPLLTYPLTENIGTFSAYFGEEGELLQDSQQEETVTDLETIDINEEALKSLRRLYAQTTDNKTLVYATNNAIGTGQISNQCMERIEKLQAILKELEIKSDRNEGRKDAIESDPKELVLVPPPSSQE